jgi:putrescine:ornithine antiporter
MQRAGWVAPQGRRAGVAALVIALFAGVSPVSAQKPTAPAAKPAAPAQKQAGPTQAPPSALKRIKDTGRIRLGYVPDARPYSFKDGSGNAAGYAVDLCGGVANAVKAELGLSSLAIDWVSVAAADQFRSVQQGDVDVLCGSARETLSSRKEADFSIPIFPGGLGALLRTDAPARLRDVLENRKSSQPSWRANATQLLQTQTFAVITGSPAESWVNAKLSQFQISAKVVGVESNDAGFKALLNRQAEVFFGDRAVLLDALQRNLSKDKLVPVGRLFTYEPVALAMGLGNDDLRLIVDRALSKFYAGDGVTTLFTKYFGKPDENTLTYFRWSALPD